MTALALGTLLATALATAAPAAPPSNPGSEDFSTLEYHLAAAAQPGDALSDQLLARMLQQHLRRDVDAAWRGPGELHQHLRAEQGRLQAQADTGLMDDPFLLGMRLECREDGTERQVCDTRRARLSTLDTDNAYHALVRMIAAWTVGDDAGFLHAAAQGAAATRYEPAFPRVLRSLNARFDSVPAVAVPGMPVSVEGIPRSSAAAMAMTAAFAMPAFQWFVTPCRDSADSLRQHCRAIARRMQDNEGSALDAYIGLSVLQIIGEPEEQTRAAERRRELDWIQQQSAALMSDKAPGTIAGLADYFRLFGEQGELPAMRNVLKANGVPVMPPASWTMGPDSP